MSLLHDIQTSLAQDGVDLSAILLKLRVLAARLGSQPLEEWIKHESEGYPPSVDVPSYRVTEAAYRGTFWGPLGAAINNAQIPPAVIDKYAGKHWTNFRIRQGIAEIDTLVKQSSDGEGTFTFDASNLMLFLQGKIYEGYSCNGITASIPRVSLIQIQQAVRMRILDFTLELEKSVPSATEISFASSRLSEESDSAKATQIYQQIIYGDVASNVTAISGGQGSQISLSIGQGDKSALIESLAKAGISKGDASQLAEIVASEKPTSKEEPFGKKAKAWLATNLRKAVDGTWKIPMGVAVNVLTEAVKKFHGLN